MLSNSIYIAISIVSTLAVSAIFIKKNMFRRPISIFIVLFIIGQVIGYGIDIDFLKVNTAHGDSGTSYSLVSTAIPLASAFITDYSYRLFKRQNPAKED